MAILIERKLRRRRRKQQDNQQQDDIHSAPNSQVDDVPVDSRLIFEPALVNDAGPIILNTTTRSQKHGQANQNCTVSKFTVAGNKPLLAKARQSSCCYRTKSLSRAYQSSTMLLLIVSLFALMSMFSTNNANLSQASSITSQQQPQQGNSVIAQQPATIPSQRTRYKTMYACEDRQLTMDCDYGYKINLIRANFGRFSIATCNEQGTLDLSTDCISPSTHRIMKERCENKQKCSVNATVSIFGDRCPKTRKYLEVHFQCLQDPNSVVERVSLGNSSGAGRVHIFPPTYGPSATSPIQPPNNLEQMQQQQQHPPTSTGSHFSQYQPAEVPVQPAQLPAQQSTTVINSEILNYNLLADPRFSSNNSMLVSDNNGQIQVTFRHASTENMSNPRCNLWDATNKKWTEFGGTLIETNLTHTTCAFDQQSSYLLVMDYQGPYPIMPSNDPFSNPSQWQRQQQQQQQQQPSQVVTKPSVPAFGPPMPDILEHQPVDISSQNLSHSKQDQQQIPSSVSSVMRFFSLFGYLLAFVFIAVGFMTIAFIASSMRSSAGAALKSIGNFSPFSGPKYKNNRRKDGSLHNKDLLVINNQNGHQFLYAPANTTKINSSASTHILSGGIGHQGTLHQIHQQQQLYSGQGTLSNLSGTGGQSNNYYYGLMGLNNHYQQQQQLHLGQHHLNQQQHQMNQQQALASQQSNYLHQANKSIISTESANSTPSSSGVESGSTSIQQQQQMQQQQANCLVMGSSNANGDFNLMGGSPWTSNKNYDHRQNLLLDQQQQPTLTLNAHYSSSGGDPNVLQHRLLQSAALNPLREHIYECVDDDNKLYGAANGARLLMPSAGLDQFSSNTLSQHQTLASQQAATAANARAMTLSSRLIQQQHQQNAFQNNQQQAGGNKRLFSHHPAIIRDNNQAKTSIICSKIAQVTPQRATEINNKQQFQHDVMAIFNNETNTTTTAANSSSANSNSSSCYGRTDLQAVLGNKLSTDC